METTLNQFYADLLTHSTRVQYDERRAAMLQLISRKIAYKERLLMEFDTEFSDALHKRLISAETEVNALLSFVKAFDAMADYLQSETAGAVDEWHQTRQHSTQVEQQNRLLNQLIDAQTERAESWSDTAFKLAQDYQHTLRNQTQCLKQN